MGVPKAAARPTPAAEPLPAGLVEALREPCAYPNDPGAVAGVDEVQTHVSHVFLTRERVYKLRKAVDHGFIRFGRLEQRNADCVRELRLNRRFAPDVYLGLAPVLPSDGGFTLGKLREGLLAAGVRETPEHCVVMRRLPDGRDALSLLEGGALRGRHVDALAESLAAFHEANRLGRPAPFATDEWLERVAAPVEGNFEVLERGPALVPRATLERVQARARAFLAQHRDRFEARRIAGRAVDGHGDLHLQHVWFERDDAPPVVIDCLEFRDDFRLIDAASDVAFLAMDLVYRRRARFAGRLLRVYARAADDFDLYAVVDYYLSYRAAVRAKVAALSARDPSIPGAQRRGAQTSARRHLALADRCLAPPGRGGLVVLCGVVGTGKSTVADAVAEALGGAVVASDRVRKRLAGLGATERVTGAAQRDLYSPERTARVYAGLLERAAPVVASGRTAVLDATFPRAPFRDRALAFARERGLPALLVEVRCPERVALARLARRRREGRDPSDAGPELYRSSADGFEPVAAGEGVLHLVVDTSTRGWRARLRRAPELAAFALRAPGPTQGLR